MLIQIILAGVSNPWFLSDIRKAIYNKLMMADIPYFDSTETGTLISRITQDCAIINEIYVTKFIQAFQNMVQTVAGIILSFIVSWRVTLSVILAIPLAGAVFLYGEYLISKIWHNFNASNTTAATKAEQVILAFRTVKSFDNELLEADNFHRSIKEVDTIYDKISYIRGIKDGAIQIFMQAMIIGFEYFSCWIINHKPEWGMTSGDIMILLLSLSFANIGITQTLSIAGDFKKAGVSANKILDILEMEQGTDQRSGSRMDGQVKGKVEFRDVSFRYATSDSYAVKNLSFTVEPGQTVALIGESGCGKSTTLQLLQRFYEIECGQILIDDVDIRTLSPQYLRSQISIVPQSPVLFSMSIKDNIRYALPDADDCSVSSAAQIGNAHDFIMSMPDNYRTTVEPTALSGGQKQRICISRAVLLDAPILLLDEATAALDTESERLVQESLESARRGKTAIMVAHRLATVVSADVIFVFKDGRVVECGSHMDLLAQNGIYADLVKYQLQ